jgi:hypothetical protein
MKKNELKKILKPVIKECIKECIFEDGVLSGIISEVFKGLESKRIVSEGLTIKTKPKEEKAKDEKNKLEEEYEKQRQERIKRLNESVSVSGVNGVNVFEGVTPTLSESDPVNPLSTNAPDDSGVDIDGILGLANGKWKQLI